MIVIAKIVKVNEKKPLILNLFICNFGFVWGEGKSVKLPVQLVHCDA